MRLQSLVIMMGTVGCGEYALQAPSPCERSSAGPTDLPDAFDDVVSASEFDVQVQGQAAFADLFTFELETGDSELFDYTGAGAVACPTGRVSEVPLDVRLATDAGLTGHGPGRLLVHENGDTWLTLELDGSADSGSQYDVVLQSLDCAGPASLESVEILRALDFSAANSPATLGGAVEALLQGADGRCRESVVGWTRIQ